ncbi:MAG: leucyl/phenylalanyl-tRNA--protein transferase [Spongiibacteraceae bacterium]
MTSLPWLSPNNIDFPSTDLALAEPNGLLAVGGDLSPQRLINAYRQGIFPWYDHPQPILWWSPSPRAVLFPSKIHISNSLRKRLHRNEYTVSCDQQFEQVVQHCATVPRQDQDGTWITKEMFDAYSELHRRGIAHSVEVWHEGQLAGGLYGLAIGKVFFGESMFSLRTDASKVAIVHLAKQLEHWGYALIDCQVTNPHLLTLGIEEIDRPQFTTLLKANIDLNSSAKWPRYWNWKAPVDMDESLP